MSTPIDRRRNIWTIGLSTNNMIVYGKLHSSRKQVKENKIIQIEHFWNRKSKDNKLNLISCTDVNCNIGVHMNTKCIVQIEKSNSLIIKGKVTKIEKNGFKINQSKLNIENELKNLLNTNEITLDKITHEPQITISPYDEKINLIKQGIKKSNKQKELINIYKENFNKN